MTELHDLTALEQAAAVRAGEVSPVDLAQHALERAERIGPQVGAFVVLTPDQALAQARAAEAAVVEAARAGTVDQLPPLHGVPTAVKDLNLVAGVPCSLGSAAYAGWVPADDDGVVRLLRGAGLASVGKTNTPEFGLPCYTENRVAPPARTPWDLSRSAGGSSGGAGAAVAAGIVPVAQGSDGGGSIRIPASVCGLVGLKPTRGRVSPGPLLGDVSGLSTGGPLARTVADAAALLDVLTGAWPGDPYPPAPPPPGGTFLAHVGRDPGRLRVGRFRTPVVADTALHPDVVAAYDAAGALLADLGHEVVDVDPPFGPEVVPTFETVWSVLATLTPVPAEREELLMPLTRWLRERGRGTSGTDYALALGAMQAATRRTAKAYLDVDVVLTPTLADLPAPVGGLLDEDDPAADFEAQKRFTPFTSIWNVTGRPAVSLPLHWTADGLPVGVMLAGAPAGEWQLLELAAQLEAAAPWAQRRPACW